MRGSARPTSLKSCFSSPGGSARTWDGSRRRSIALKASALSGAGALSTTTTLPPGAQPRRISASTARGSRKWWNANRALTIVNEPSGQGRGRTSPCRQVTLVRPRSCWRGRARSSMAGVMSIPVAWRTTRAKAHTSRPGPHATSSTVSAGPAPLHSTTSLSAASSLMEGAVENGTAWRVNWSRIRSECSLVDTATFHDQAETVLILEDAKVLQRVAGHHEQVGVLARLDAADLVLHPEQLGVDAGRREQDLHRRHHLGLQLQLHGALAHHVAEQVRPRADLAPRAVGVGEALHALLAGEVDLLDLVIADAVALALAIDGLVGHHRRHDEGAGLLDGLGRAFADQVAVLDRAYAGLDGATHGRVTVRVREHVLADGLGLLDGGAHLGDRVLRRVELVRRGHGAARGHDLDLVHVATKLLARGLADLVDAVGDGADHADAAAHGIDPFGAPALVTVAAGLGRIVARDEQPWPREMAFLQRQPEAVIRTAGIADRREALHQALLGAAHGAGGDVAGGIVAVLVGDVLGDRADVDVGVGEPGHQRGALAVERGHRPGQRADRAVAGGVLDGVGLDDDRRALDGVGARAVDQERIGEDRDAHRAALSCGATAPRSWGRTSTPSRRRVASTPPCWPRRRGRPAARGRPTAPRPGPASATRRRRPRGPWDPSP